MSKKMKIEKYASNPEQFVSVLRMVPIQHLECVREKVKEVVSRIEMSSSSKLDVRVRFRGPRYDHPMHTHKWAADAFDVYVNTKNLPRRLSNKQRLAIAHENRQNVIYNLRYEDFMNC